MDHYIAFRLEAGDAGPQWLPHPDWCETPDPLREPLTRDGALDLIHWDRTPGDRYSIRKACPGDMT